MRENIGLESYQSLAVGWIDLTSDGVTSVDQARCTQYDPQDRPYLLVEILISIHFHRLNTPHHPSRQAIGFKRSYNIDSQYLERATSLTIISHCSASSLDSLTPKNGFDSSSVLYHPDKTLKYDRRGSGGSGWIFQAQSRSERI